MIRRAAVRNVLLALAVVVGAAGGSGAVDVGQKAPEFTLPDQSGKQVTLSDLTAKGPVVIYTFIQAFTGT
jgi:cytochrome oxidase Cu insertion factor (SCO1/SenC/PrrC family)